MKVFRKWKLMASLTDPTALMIVDQLMWPVVCDGLPLDKLKELGFDIDDRWCEEVDDEI